MAGNHFPEAPLVMVCWRNWAGRKSYKETGRQMLGDRIQAPDRLDRWAKCTHTRVSQAKMSDPGQDSWNTKGSSKWLGRRDLAAQPLKMRPKPSRDQTTWGESAGAVPAKRATVILSA